VIVPPLPRVRAETGAGAVLALAIVATCSVFGVGAVSLAGLTARQRLIGAGDLAALAAADAASGAVAGAPCEIARRVAASANATVSTCQIDGLVVGVTVVGSFAGIPITSRSRAGPPP
jgi:secretion/DNA translocation related TadE-like protein